MGEPVAKAAGFTFLAQRSLCFEANSQKTVLKRRAYRSYNSKGRLSGSAKKQKRLPVCSSTLIS